MVSKISAAAILSLATVLASCGGDDVDCSFTACGGDPIGSWTIDGLCVDSAIFLRDIQSQCPEATGTAAVSAGGSYDFESDLSFSYSLTIASRMQVSVPASCLQEELTSCEQLDTEGLSCEGDPQVGCDCTLIQTQLVENTGTYVVDRNRLNLTNDPNFSNAVFCVEGDTLKIQSIPDQPDEPPGTLVLSRN